MRKTLLACAATLLCALALPAQTAVGGSTRNVPVMLWVVTPSNDGGAWLAMYDYVTGCVEFTELGPSFQGWGDLPSAPVVSLLELPNATLGDPDPPPMLRTKWTDKNGLEHEVTTPVQGVSEENHARALKQHAKDVAAMIKLFPPPPKKTN